MKLVTVGLDEFELLKLLGQGLRHRHNLTKVRGTWLYIEAISTRASAI